MTIDATKVRDWLERGGFSPQELEDDQALWHLGVRFPHPESPSVELVCSKTRSHFVIVGRHIAVADVHQHALSKLTPEAYRQFRFDVTHDLLVSGRTLYRLDVDDSEQLFRSFTVFARIWEDELSAATIHRAIQSVHDMSAVVGSRIRLVSGSSP